MNSYAIFSTLVNCFFISLRAFCQDFLREYFGTFPQNLMGTGSFSVVSSMNSIKNPSRSFSFISSMSFQMVSTDFFSFFSRNYWKFLHELFYYLSSSPIESSTNTSRSSFEFCSMIFYENSFGSSCGYSFKVSPEKVPEIPPSNPSKASLGILSKGSRSLFQKLQL